MGWVAGKRGVAAAAQAACREGPSVEVGGRARAERTKSMYCMDVTLDVSKLNDWLNADAIWQVEREA